MDDVRQVAGELAMSVWVGSALSAALESGIAEELGTPATSQTVAQRTGISCTIVQTLLDVLQALGLARREGDDYVAEPGLAAAIGPGRESLMAGLYSTLLQGADLAQRARHHALTGTWVHSDPEILGSQGALSAGLVTGWVSHAISSMEGLGERLRQESAAFLDVGVGVAAISIEMCRRFPMLRAVGLDPHEPALAEAKENVAGAGLTGRIELRPTGVEALDEGSAFDLANVPIMFLPADVAERGLQAVWKALRPGGWVLVQVVAAPGDELVPAMTRLLCALWGSDPTVPDRVLEMLDKAGYVDTAILPSWPGPPARHVVGRKALTW
jgi:SAM-dependent methyltransferase